MKLPLDRAITGVGLKAAFRMRGRGLDLMFRWSFLLHLDHHRLADIPYLKHQELEVIGRA